MISIEDRMPRKIFRPCRTFDLLCARAYIVSAGRLILEIYRDDIAIYFADTEYWRSLLRSPVYYIFDAMILEATSLPCHMLTVTTRAKYDDYCAAAPRGSARLLPDYCRQPPPTALPISLSAGPQRSSSRKSAALTACSAKTMVC